MSRRISAKVRRNIHDLEKSKSKNVRSRAGKILNNFKNGK